MRRVVNPRLILISLSVSLIVILIAAALVERANADRDQTAYENQIAGCERGNVLREIVFSNTKTATVENAGTPIGERFAANLRALKTTEGADPKTGAIDCRAVIDAP